MSGFRLAPSKLNLIFFLQIKTAAARSHKIGLMEVGEELGRRGHQVTVVSPQRYKAVPPNVTDIVIDSEFEALSNRMTTDLVANDKPSSAPFLEVRQKSHRDRFIKTKRVQTIAAPNSPLKDRHMTYIYVKPCH